VEKITNIALTGAMRAGKDEVGRYLSQKYGYTRFAFADEMKRIARELFPTEFEADRKPRELLQWFGETMRQRDPDVWVRRCCDKMARAAVDCEWDNGNYSYPFRAVITDLRLPVEYDRCRAEGFVIIRVKATSGLRIQRAVESSDTFDLRDLTHETEQYTDGFDVGFEITNDGTLAELYAKVDEIIAAF